MLCGVRNGPWHARWLHVCYSFQVGNLALVPRNERRPLMRRRYEARVSRLVARRTLAKAIVNSHERV